MTQDEIIEMAKQAGFVEKDAMFRSVYLANIKDLEAFAKLVALRYQKKIADLENIICQRHWDVLQEREACAIMSDWILKDGGGTWGDAIRKREQI
jgi:hypothetical protein